jgi:hypothetical protein
MKSSIAFTLLAASLVLGGCEDGITTDAQPRVTVLVQSETCAAPIAGDPIDSTLGVSGVCPYRGTTQLFAGVNQLQVIVDYGDDVEFDTDTEAPPPDITLLVDGIDLDVPVTMSDEIRVGERAYFIATLTAPPEPSQNIRIGAGVNAGFRTLVPEVLTSIAPPVFLRILECGNNAVCEVSGGVGAAHIEITAFGVGQQLVNIHSTLDGVPQPDPIPPVRTFPRSNDETYAITGVPVPPAPDDTNWVITAELGTQTWEARTLIRAPQLIARLTCGTTCSLDSGDPVGLEILAPSQIRPLEAFVTTRLDGNPELVSVRVPLEQRADGTALGLLGLTAPPGSGNWQIDVNVAGYPAPTIVTPVQ